MAELPKAMLEWYVQETRLVARFTRTLPVMAVVAGVAVRLWRDVLLASSSSSSWVYLIITYIGQPIILLGFAASNLGNYPVKRWLWRAPLFGLLAGVSEAAASRALIALHYERLGTDFAHAHEWRGLAVLAVAVDFVLVVLFAIVLGIVMQIIRYSLLKREHRAHTITAVHEERLRVTKEHELKTET